MFLYKKNFLKKQEKKKFVYKYKYNADFLSKQKKNINDVDIFEQNFLLHNEKLPIRNKNTGKFLFNQQTIGNIVYGESGTNLVSKPVNTGRLVFLNKNKVWNIKSSKIKIKTKSAITAKDKIKQTSIFNSIYFRKIFSELKADLLKKETGSTLFKDDQRFANFYDMYLNSRRLEEDVYDKYVLQRIRRAIKENKGKNTAEFERYQKLLRRRMFFDKKKYKEEFLKFVNVNFQEKFKLNKFKSFKLTIAQMVLSNVYLGANDYSLSSVIRPFLLGKRNGFYIINLSFTYIQFKVLINFIINIISFRRKILIVKEYDMFNLNLLINYSNIFYCDNKWIGGSLTNHRVVRLCDKFKQRNYAINSLLHMSHIPSLLFLFDPNVSMSALFEGFNLRVPISAIVNTNCSFFESLNYPIVGNNDSFESVYLYMNVLKNAVKMGVQKEYRKVLRII